MLLPSPHASPTFFAEQSIPSIPRAELGTICKVVSRLRFLSLAVLSSDFSHRVEENDFSVLSIFYGEVFAVKRGDLNFLAILSFASLRCSSRPSCR